MDCLPMTNGERMYYCVHGSYLAIPLAKVDGDRGKVIYRDIAGHELNRSDIPDIIISVLDRLVGHAYNHHDNGFPTDLAHVHLNFPDNGRQLSCAVDKGSELSMAVSGDASSMMYFHDYMSAIKWKDIDVSIGVS